MSYHGTVTCSHCYQRGHNMRGCPEMKKQAAADPNSYAATKLSRMKPRTCTYCEGTGHNRRGCSTLKSHKATFTSDTHLWRQAFAKWATAQGAAFGAIVSAPISWQDHKGNYHNGDEKPLVGLLQDFGAGDGDSLDHRQMQGGLRDWHVLSIEIIGGEIRRNGRPGTQGLMLPDIPLIAPGTGEDHWGYSRTRNDEQSRWTVASPSPVGEAFGTFTALEVAEERATEWFRSGKEANTKNSYFEMTAPQREAIKEYLNDSATLDDLHNRLNPSKDDNSESNNE